MRINRILRPSLCAGLILATSGAMASETVTMVHPTDPVFAASVWPIQNGKVKSDKVDLQVTFTSIQAVIQAAATQQYDLVPMVTNILPRLAERGLPIKLIATNQRYSFSGGGSHLYVAASGPIKGVADLKGKTIGVTSLNSSGVTAVRIILSQVYKTNAAFDGGDFKWVEMPMAVLPTALASGRIDGAVLSNEFVYQASKNKDDRDVVPEGLKDALGVAVPSTMVISYEPKLKARPEAFMEAARLLKASAVYVSGHRDEVFAAVGKAENVDPAYLQWYYTSYAEIPYDLVKDDLKGIEALWKAVEKLHMIQTTPNLKDLIWDRAAVE
jgi:ABC-type nitrate/sulfonate/bicarbonate transport system substrate-binding protein